MDCDETPCDGIVLRLSARPHSPATTTRSNHGFVSSPREGLSCLMSYVAKRRVTSSVINAVKMPARFHGGDKNA